MRLKIYFTKKDNYNFQKIDIIKINIFSYPFKYKYKQLFSMLKLSPDDEYYNSYNLSSFNFEQIENNNILNEIDKRFELLNPIEKTKTLEKTENIFEKIKYAPKDICKAKRLIFLILQSYANYLISKVYKGNVGSGIFEKKIKKIKPSLFQCISVDYNNQLLNMTLAEIFSEDLNKRFNCSKNHNKKLIEKLLNEEDEEKRKKFSDFFNLTLTEGISCLSNPNDELKMCYEKVFKKFVKKDENLLKNIINNLKIIFSQKKPRKKKSNNRK